MAQFYISNSVAVQTKTSSTAFLLYQILCKASSNKTRSSFYSRKKLAKACRCSLSALDRAKKELLSLGFLHITKRKRKTGKDSSNLYTLLDEPQTRLLEKPPKDAPFFYKQDSRLPEALKGMNLKLYHCLFLLQKQRGNPFSVPVAEVAAYMHCSKRTVQRLLKHLISYGLLQIERHDGACHTYMVRTALEAESSLFAIPEQKEEQEAVQPLPNTPNSKRETLLQKIGQVKKSIACAVFANAFRKQKRQE